MQSAPKSWLETRAVKLFEIDLRSLALFRMALGFVILLDLVGRLSDLQGHYTDAGVWPRWLAREELVLDRHWYFSLHLFGGSTGFEAALFAIAAALAVMLMIGYRTRLVTVLSWVLLISLHTRMQRVVNSGDMLLRMLLFWGMFLPLGAKWSLDVRRKKESPAGSVLSMATIALLLQVCIVYWFSAAYKWEIGWTGRGESLRDALSMETLTTQFGSSLLSFPGLLRIFGFLVLGLEIAGPALAIVSVRDGRLRTAVVFVFWIFHLGVLGTTMKIGLFPLISATSWLVFLPPWFWERILRRVSVDSEVVMHGNQIADRVAGAVFVVLLLWNFRDLNPRRFALLPHVVDPLVYALNLDQRWAMFSGRRASEMWQHVPARLQDGTEVNLLNGTDCKLDQRPVRLSEQFHTFRWSLYPGWANNTTRPKRFEVYADYLKREWNENHPPEKQVVSLEIYCMRERFGMSPRAAVPELLYSSSRPQSDTAIKESAEMK